MIWRNSVTRENIRPIPYVAVTARRTTKQAILGVRNATLESQSAHTVYLTANAVNHSEKESTQ